VKPTALFIASLLGLGLVAKTTTAQVFQVVGQQLGDVSTALSDIQGKSHVYQSTDPKELKLFYLPFFALEEDKPGSHRPMVQVQRSPNPGNGLVTVTLLLSPENLVEEVAAYIRGNAEMKAVDSRYALVTNFNLIGIPLRNLSIDEINPRMGFNPITLPNYGAQGVLQLVAEMPMAQAQEWAEDIRKGDRKPQFDIHYDLSTDQQLSQTDIQSSMAYIYETNAVKNLNGAKAAGEKFGWKVGGNGVQIEQPFLTRGQKQLFEGRTKAEVAVIVKIGDNEDAEFVKQMLAYVEAVLKKSAIDTDATPLGRELKNLSSYGLDPGDLKADSVDKLVANVKAFFSQEDADKKNFEAGASASFLGIGASGSVKTSGESLRKQMRDNGWDFQAKGSFLVPKSFEVHIVNCTKLRTEGVVSGAIIRQKRGFTGFIHRVSVSTLYHPDSAKGKDKFVERLTAIMKTKVFNAQQTVGNVVVPGGLEHKPQTPLINIELPKGVLSKGKKIAIGFVVTGAEIKLGGGIHFIPQVNGAVLGFDEFNRTIREGGQTTSYWEITVNNDVTSLGMVAEIGGAAPPVRINGIATITVVLLE
jgi:hypothetical protein